ncbi:transglutaminase family protein [Proteus sp. ZN5]|uniref:transglutaminase-like domain-containing protein n=1 Tax=Proteus sp. ZN5 TaxID=2697019 RepID=UPI0013E1FCC8|nr:transglutaminase family protein [Proteus sp. ZN5]QIG06174.1 transglutaminase [Proteus sp. ZN5]
MSRYLEQTQLLDYNSENIQKLISEKGWKQLPIEQRVADIYNFCRDEIRFGFNEDDSLTASYILNAGYGQCNTKSILFMALLRAVDVECRLHGFTIDKSLQKGIMTGQLYELMPQEISHTWVEAYINDKWFNFEGLILDMPYLNALQKEYSEESINFVGFGVAIEDLQNAPVSWLGDNDTYIQRAGIVQDFGLFDSPDLFFEKHAQSICEKTKQLFANTLRHKINDNIHAIRQCKFDQVN